MRAANHLASLQMFARVAELSSFTLAAESLGLPKASASNAVRRLEQHVGMRLFQRTTRRVELTQEGRAFYERCKDVLADLDDLQSMFRQGDTLRGRLRVDMTSALATRFVIPRLPEFLTDHPHLEIELSSADRRVDLVREGIDCVLRVGPLHDSTLVARPLGWYPQINVATPAYLARHGVPTSLDDLRSHRLVHYVPTLGARPVGWEYVEDGKTRTIAMAGALTVNHVGSYQAACLAGLGIIQAPAPGLRELIATGTLVEILPDFRAPSMPVTILYPHRRHLPKRVRVFIDWIDAILKPFLQDAA
jgi:DNA-binding transcriptional LysR family regulator